MASSGNSALAAFSKAKETSNKLYDDDEDEEQEQVKEASIIDADDVNDNGEEEEEVESSKVAAVVVTSSPFASPQSHKKLSVTFAAEPTIKHIPASTASDDEEENDGGGDDWADAEPVVSGAHASHTEEDEDEQEDENAALIEKLVPELKRLGKRVSDGSYPFVLFGQVARDSKIERLFDSVGGILKAAKDKGVISYDGSILLEGKHDKVEISLVDSIFASIKVEQPVAKVVQPVIAKAEQPVAKAEKPAPVTAKPAVAVAKPAVAAPAPAPATPSASSSRTNSSASAPASAPASVSTSGSASVATIGKGVPAKGSDAADAIARVFAQDESFQWYFLSFSFFNLK